MSTLKTFAKYVLLVVGIYLISSILIFIGLNVNYSDITLIGDLPEQIRIEKAEATKSNGRIYGYVSNSRDYNVNGMFILISVYNSSGDLLITEYLKIDGVSYGDEKLFRCTFSIDDAYSYSVSIVENEGDLDDNSEVNNT